MKKEIGYFVVGRIVTFWYGEDIEIKDRLGILVKGKSADRDRVYVLEGTVPWRRHRKTIPLKWIKEHFKDGGVSFLVELGREPLECMEDFPEELPNPFEFLEELETERISVPCDRSLRFRITARRT